MSWTGVWTLTGTPGGQRGRAGVHQPGEGGAHDQFALVGAFAKRAPNQTRCVGKSWRGFTPGWLPRGAVPSAEFTAVTITVGLRGIGAEVWLF